MIVTLTANSTIDQTVYVSEFIPNTTIRAHKTIHSMGGKPADASFILGQLGIPSLALGLIAGALGQKVESLLHEQDVKTDFTRADGETRMNVVIIDEAKGEETTLSTTTMSVNQDQLAELKKGLDTALDSASVFITGGTLPQGLSASFYTEIIAMARAKNVPVIFDADGDNLKAGLISRPTYIKPNRAELGKFLGQEIRSLEQVYAAGMQILRDYGTMPIATLGAEGALAILQDCAYHIPALEIEIKSAAGAGDAVLAGLAAAIHQGKSIEYGLQLGIASATAVCLQAGTARLDPADMERFFPQVELIPYP